MFSPLFPFNRALDRCPLISSMKSIRLSCIALFILLPLSASAQSPATRAGAAARSGGSQGSAARGGAVTVQQSFEPSFSIEPLSHRLAGRPGDLLTFQFTLRSDERDTNIEVVPIGLRQELTGQVLHDSQSGVTDIIRLTTPAAMTLVAGETSKIEGVVRIPKGDARFHSIGLLVRDLGANGEADSNNNSDNAGTQATIRFVTQYILRLDLQVEGARGEEGKRLVIEEAQISPMEGRPRLEVTVLNPTETAFEFNASSKVQTSTKDRSAKELPLVMPVRRNVEDDSRYRIRLLPKSRVRLEAMLPEAIATGSYEAETELTMDGRTLLKKSISIDVDASQFPAQEILIAQIDEGVQISPAQIELSQLRGGNRRITVLLQNRSSQSKKITLKALSDNQLPLGSLVIQPHEFTLAGNSSRKVSVTLRSQPNETRKVEFGKLICDVLSPERSHAATKQLPLAVLLKDSPEPELEVGPLQFDPAELNSCFRSLVRNEGDVHTALNARLTIVHESGKRISIPAGYGRWLMPQTAAPLEFRLDSPLSTGQYQLTLEIQRQGTPLVRQQAFTVTDLETAQKAY